MNKICVLFACIFFLFGCNSNSVTSDMDDGSLISSDANAGLSSSGGFSSGSDNTPSSSSSSSLYELFVDSRDGRTYKTVKIGTQIWMAENLAYLPKLSGIDESSYTEALYYVMGNESSVLSEGMSHNYTEYGALYNYPAAMNACPTGWHLPSMSDWNTLFSFVGGTDSAGNVLKAPSQWDSGKHGATDYGFSALSGGFLGENISGQPAFYRSEFGAWWGIEANGYIVNDMYSDVYSQHYPYDFGLSVRCIQNDSTFIESSSSSSSPLPISYGVLKDERDGNSYKTVVIGSQTWMAENLAYLPSVERELSNSYTNRYYYVNGYDGTNVDSAKLSDNYKMYGALYNYLAALEACPSGWHLPSSAEWRELITYVDSNNAAVKLKSTNLWPSLFVGSNDYGFSALPGGHKHGMATVLGYHSFSLTSKFVAAGSSASWWMSDKVDSSYAYSQDIWLEKKTHESYLYRISGLSVRCLLD